MAVSRRAGARRRGAARAIRCVTSGRTGIAYGSSSGSRRTRSWAFADMMENGSRPRHQRDQLPPDDEPHGGGEHRRCSSASPAAIIPTSSACTSGSQGDRLRVRDDPLRQAGRDDRRRRRGARRRRRPRCSTRCSPPAPATTRPQPTPRPFDRDRDGLVHRRGRRHVGARGARACAGARRHGSMPRSSASAPIRDGSHVTQPQRRDDGRPRCAWRWTTRSLAPDAIGYVNAPRHRDRTGRHRREPRATAAVFGARMPIQLAEELHGPHARRLRRARGVAGIEMMRDGWFAPTANLENVDPRCARAGLHHRRGPPVLRSSTA